MDAGNLVANTALSTVGWLSGEARAAETRLARAAQQSLVSLVVSSSGHPGYALRRPANLQHALIEEINRQSGNVVRIALRALRDARKSGVKYRLQYDDAEGRTSDHTYSFDSLPFGGGFDTAFEIALHVRKLAPRQQVALVRHLFVVDKLSTDKAYKERLGYTGTKQEMAICSRDLDALEARAAKSLKSLDPQAQGLCARAVAALCTTFWHDYPLPVAIDCSTPRRGLREIAAWMDRMGEEMLPPVAFDVDCAPSALATASAAWARYVDCGNVLRVLAVWLRAIATDGGGRPICRLCYRHLRKGAKHFCVQHTRTKKVQPSAIERHTSRLYHQSQAAFFAAEPRLADLSTSSDWIKADSALMLCRARDPEEGLDLPSELHVPAAVLATLLREVWPAIGPELRSKVGKHFYAMLMAAKAPFTAGGRNDPSASTAQRKVMFAADKWLAWNTFMESWFGTGLEGPGGAGHLAGCKADVDHPMLRDEAPPQGSVVLDLARQRLWTRATREIKTAYLTREVVKSALEEGLSPEKIGQALNASTQAVYETIKLGSGASSGGTRRDRILPRMRVKLLGGYPHE